MRWLIALVCPTGQAEERQFQELTSVGRGLADIRSLALALAGEPGPWRVLVASDSPAVLDAARALEIETLDLAAVGSAAAELPPGAAEAVLALKNGPGGGAVRPEDSLVLMDWRNTDLTPTEILGIAGRLAERPGLWTGIARPEDHPIQMEFFLEQLELSLHLAADAEASAALGLAATPWHSMGSAEELLSGTPFGPSGSGPEELLALLRLPAGGLGCCLEVLARPRAGRSPAELAELARACPAGDLLFLAAAQGRCRHLAVLPEPWPQGALLPFGQAPGQAALLVLPDAGGLEVFVRALEPGAYLLHAFAPPASLDDTGENLPLAEAWFVLHGGEEPALRVGATAYVGPVACFSLDAETGLDKGVLLCLEGQVLTGLAHRIVSLSMEGGGWELSTAGVRVNSATGLPVAGRQDFPPLWEMDFSLLALPVGQAHLLLEPMGLAPEFLAGGFVLGPRSVLGRALRLGLPLSILAPDGAKANEES